MKRLGPLLLVAALTVAALTLACAETEENAAPQPAATAAPQDPPLMPQTGHRVEWGTPGVPCTMKAGSKQPVSVIVRNVGDQFWYSLPATISGRGAIRLGARWWSPRDTKAPFVDYGEARGDLHTNLGPSQTATITLEVMAPSAPGAYLLQLDLVEEMVIWFQSTGAAKLTVPVTVN